jgi:hypothetical protein
VSAGDDRPTSKGFPLLIRNMGKFGDVEGGDVVVQEWWARYMH